MAIKIVGVINLVIGYKYKLQLFIRFYYRCHLAARLFANMPWSTSGSNKVWIFIKYYYECLEVIIMITSQISLTTFFFFICRNQARSCFWTTKAGCVPSSESCCVWVTAGWWDWWEWKVCISFDSALQMESYYRISTNLQLWYDISSFISELVRGLIDVPWLARPQDKEFNLDRSR